MKNSAYCLRLLLSVSFLTLLLASCSITDDTMRGGTATLVLDVPMLQASARATVEGDAEENAIYNLRVVILSQGAESINQTFAADALTGGSVVIDNVPVGEAQIYVIANEGSIGKDYTDLSNLQTDVVTVGENKKVLIMDESRTYFPKRRSELDKEIMDEAETRGLPMSWMDKNLTVSPPSGTPQRVEVKLQRCVAKLNIIMQSTLSEDLHITEMNFGAFFGDRLYLFQETDLDVPDDASYVAKDYTGLDTELNIIIPANGEKTLVCYIYPSFAWKDPGETSPYTIGFMTTNNSYDPQVFISDGSALNSIARNTQVNITAKLSKPANIKIDFEVVPWETVTVDVPSFN